ncbi:MULTISPECIES: hypothetical protein [Streptomyces]|uniref:hypothetical protein n=1 Tax=Streptomyces TaxID=1883 RepID=UPI00240D2F4D|nr:MULTISPECIES: hypothetical protein [Streptomyces]WFB88441.1 hypothetical protein MMU79_36980 [Streptomyces olivaceus]WGK50884.1 hypothetical protein M6G09_37725 [Streptomyces sp. B146]
MVAVTHTTRNIEITAENLQEELHRLKAQQQALERELAAVTAHLGSVQQALAALQGLTRTGLPAVDVPVGTSPVAEVPAEAVLVAEPADSADPSPSASAEARAVADDRTEAPGSAPERAQPAQRRSERTASDQGKYGKLTEQIMEFFAGTAGTAVRARDVAAALGRDTDAGSINAVRSTLDRLVGTSRVQRAGRGLYRAHSS